MDNKKTEILERIGIQYILISKSRQDEDNIFAVFLGGRIPNKSTICNFLEHGWL